MRTHRLRLRLQRRRVVRRPMRQLRLLVRQRVVRCCLVVVARRRLVRRLVMQLAVRVGRLNLRAWLRVRLWLVVVDQRMRLEQLQLRRLVLEVGVHRRHRRRQAKLRVLRWWLMVGLLMKRLMRQHRQRRMRVLLWTMLQR